MMNSRTKYKNPPDNQDFSPLLGFTSVEMREEDMHPYFSIAALGIFAQTCQQAESETAFLRLLAASIHAAPEFLSMKEDVKALAAMVILKKHPELLFRKKKVTDHYDRKILASPYQIFLSAGDIWALRQIKKDILPLIKNGREQADAQFKEQFPDCPWPLPENFSEEMLYDDRNRQQIKNIMEQLTVVKQLINVDPFNNDKPLDITQQAIETLCQLFQPKPEEVIQSGLHFPLGILKEVYKTYNALLGHWSFFSLAVIKPALDALSTVDRQCCRGGLSELNTKDGPNRRCHPSYQHPLGQPLSLMLVDDKKKRGPAVIVDPYDGDVLFVSTSYSGYFDCFNKNGIGGTRYALGVARSWPALVGKFMERKSKILWELLGGHTKRNQHAVANITG